MHKGCLRRGKKTPELKEVILDHDCGERAGGDQLGGKEGLRLGGKIANKRKTTLWGKENSWADSVPR